MPPKKIIFILFVLMMLISVPLWAAPAKPLRISASTLVGFDNNAALNANRQEDFFGQETVALSYSEPLEREKPRLRLNSYLLNVNYSEATDQNVLLPIGGAGLDYLITPTTLIESDYKFEFIYFPNDESVTSYTHEGRIGLKQKLNNSMLLRGGYGVSEKSFDERKARQANSVLSPDEERMDLRHFTDPELWIKVSQGMLLRIGFVYYWNDSNDHFHDYYDYNSYKASASVSVKLHSKVSGIFKFSYERRDYESRSLLDDKNAFQEDDVYSGSVGLFYKYTPNISLGTLYNYRQKNSNEPSQKYSGSISTIGFYYSF